MSEKEFWLIFFKDGKRQISEVPVAFDAVFYNQEDPAVGPMEIEQIIHVVEYCEPTRQDLVKERNEWKFKFEHDAAYYYQLERRFEGLVKECDELRKTVARYKRLNEGKSYDD